MYDNLLSRICIAVSLICGHCVCYDMNILVGVITESNDPITVPIIQHALSMVEETDGVRQFTFEIANETAKSNDATEVASAVCRLLKRGVQVIFSKTDALSYEPLVSYSNKFAIPLLSSGFPEVPQELRAQYAVSVQPSTVRVILDLLRYYSWKDIVYLYDAENGPEKLQTIFQLGYRVLKINLLGILQISNAEEANHYLRKLEIAKKHRNFYVILDLDPALAKDVIVRHVHDVHVGKLNFHFLVAQPVLEEFWISQAAEFGAINVTGFSTFPPSVIDTFQETWNQLSRENWNNADSRLNISAYVFHDAALVFAEGLKKVARHRRLFSDIAARRKVTTPTPAPQQKSRDCLQSPSIAIPQGYALAGYMKQSIPKNALSGKVTFDSNGKRKDFQIDIIESSRRGHQRIGFWSDTQGLRLTSQTNSKSPIALPRTGLEKIFKIISIISPPFLMLRSPTGNSSDFVGNDRFEGYCKDLLDLLAKRLGFEYELMLEKDNIHGDYDESKGEWSGLIGELIRGKADIAVSDIQITARRQRVVSFVNAPIGSTSISLLMKNPRSRFPNSGLTFFFFSGFSKEVWICVIVSAILVIVSFHFMAKFTGSPDNIEATSGIWGKKFTVVSSVWFVIGSSLMQGTGIYPRSISSRILSGTWWCFTIAVFALFIASTTSNIFVNNMDSKQNPQLARLSLLSLESILKESLNNNWPKIGILRKGDPHKFIKKSNLPMYTALASHLQNYPDYMVDTTMEGIRRVRDSKGEHAFIMESLASDYLSNGGPCDTVSVHDILPYADYGIALRLGSPYRFSLNSGLKSIIETGELAHLRRKWWVDQQNCEHESSTNLRHQNLNTMAGLFYLALGGLVLAFLVAAVQYRWKAYKKEERRQTLSFEEVAMSQSLPLPPPELLTDSPMEDSPVIDGWAERKLVPTSFTHEPQQN